MTTGPYGVRRVGKLRMFLRKFTGVPRQRNAGPRIAEAAVCKQNQEANQAMAHRGTTLQWIGVGASPSSEGIKCVTVNPDALVPSQGLPEWLVTNGLGGYASGTMTGLVTRRFHGY